MRLSAACINFAGSGKHAFVGGYSVVTKDVLPFSMTVSPRESKVFGENKVGLERRGFSKEAIESLHKAFRLLTKSGLNTTQAVERIRAEVERAPEIEELLAFMQRVRAWVREMSRYGMIAGNGRFPLLALETARGGGDEVVVLAIQEEASPEVEQLAARCYWISLGQLSRLIEILKEEGITEVMMAGPGEARQDFFVHPAGLATGEAAGVAEAEEHRRVDRRSGEGSGGRRHSSGGFHAAAEAAAGRGRRAEQTKAVRRKSATSLTAARSQIRWRAWTSARASPFATAPAWRWRRWRAPTPCCERAASLVNGKPLRLVKVSRRRGHLLFDVPVAGLGTIEAMRKAGATALAVDAGRTLLLDREAMLARANELGIAMAGYEPEQ